MKRNGMEFRSYETSKPVPGYVWLLVAIVVVMVLVTVQ